RVHRHRFQRWPGYRVIAVPWIRRGEKRNRNRLDIFGQISLGRHLQRRNETAHAAARISLCEKRCLSCGATESTLTEGDGKNRRSPRGHKARGVWTRKSCVPNHSFKLLFRRATLAIKWTVRRSEEHTSEL